MIIEKLILGRLETNCYIIMDKKTKSSMVIDPADDCEKILAKANELGANIDSIFITHAHCDHICALDELTEATGASVFIGIDDAKALNTDSYNLCREFGKASPETRTCAVLKDGQEYMLGEHSFRIIHTPGHTRGSVCIYFDGFLISGDTLFYESVGRTDFFGGSMNDLTKSIKEKLFTLPKGTIVYPGHGPETTIAHEIDNNPYIW